MTAGVGTIEAIAVGAANPKAEVDRAAEGATEMIAVATEMTEGAIVVDVAVARMAEPPHASAWSR